MDLEDQVWNAKREKLQKELLGTLEALFKHTETRALAYAADNGTFILVGPPEFIRQFVETELPKTH